MAMKQQFIEKRVKFMDMYQKREMRKNKKMNEDVKSLPSMSINWYPRTYGQNQKTDNRRFKID